MIILSKGKQNVFTSLNIWICKRLRIRSWSPVLESTASSDLHHLRRIQHSLSILDPLLLPHSSGVVQFSGENHLHLHCIDYFDHLSANGQYYNNDFCTVCYKKAWLFHNMYYFTLLAKRSSFLVDSIKRLVR